MKFTQIPENTFEELQLNAGMFLTAFDPTTATVNNTDIFGATSGGVNFTDTPSYTDFGDDIDNCPKNTKELKRIDSREIKIAGTFVTMNSPVAKSLVNGATVDGSKIIPHDDINDADFKDIWWVGDYSDKNGEKNGGFIAIRLINALSTGGFAIQSGDKSKGKFAFTYTAHYSIKNQKTVPYELYIQEGTAEAE